MSNVQQPTNRTYQRLHLSLHLRLLHRTRNLKSVYFFHHFGSSPLSPPFHTPNDGPWLIRDDWKRCQMSKNLRSSSQQAVCRWWCDHRWVTLTPPPTSGWGIPSYGAGAQWGPFEEDQHGPKLVRLISIITSVSSQVVNGFLRCLHLKRTLKTG